MHQRMKTVPDESEGAHAGDCQAAVTGPNGGSRLEPECFGSRDFRQLRGNRSNNRVLAASASSRFDPAVFLDVRCIHPELWIDSLNQRGALVCALELSAFVLDSVVRGTLVTDGRATHSGGTKDSEDTVSPFAVRNSRNAFGEREGTPNGNGRDRPGSSEARDPRVDTKTGNIGMAKSARTDLTELNDLIQVIRSLTGTASDELRVCSEKITSVDKTVAVMSGRIEQIETELKTLHTRDVAVAFTTRLVVIEGDLEKIKYDADKRTERTWLVWVAIAGGAGNIVWEIARAIMQYTSRPG